MASSEQGLGEGLAGYIAQTSSRATKTGQVPKVCSAEAERSWSKARGFCSQNAWVLLEEEISSVVRFDDEPTS